MNAGSSWNRKVSGAIEPTLPVESRNINDQSVALPSSIRCSHPRVDGRFFGRAHVDDAIRRRVLVRKHDVLLRLDNLEWIWHVRRARQTRHIAFDFRIQLQPVRKILVPLYQGLRFVGNRAALDNALPRWNCADRAELEKGSGFRGMIFNIPIRRRYRLP
jgi:hypothetical protein